MAFHLLPQIEPTPSGTKADGRAATVHWEYQGSPGSSCVVGTGTALARPQMHVFLPRSSIIFSRLNAFQFVVYLWLTSSALAWFILAIWSSFLLFFFFGEKELLASSPIISVSPSGFTYFEGLSSGTHAFTVVSS